MLDLGVEVQTLAKTGDHGFLESARDFCQWGSKGLIVKSSGSHGLCYAVEHEDGTVAWYDPTEIRALTVLDKMIEG